MKRLLIPLILLASLTTWPTTTAEQGTSHHYVTDFPNIIGIIGAGQADWYIDYPDEVHTAGGTYYIAITVSTSVAATANLALATSATHTNGCTLGTLTTDTSGTFSITGYIPVTLTDDYCSTDFRLTLTASSTTIGAIRPKINILTVSNEAETVSITSWPNLNIGSWPGLNVSGSDAYDSQIAQYNGWTMIGPPSRVDLPYSANNFQWQFKLLAIGPLSGPSTLTDCINICLTGPQIDVLDGTCTSTSVYNSAASAVTIGNSKVYRWSWIVNFNAEACHIFWDVGLYNGATGYIHQPFDTVFQRVEHPNIESWPAVSGGLTVTDDANGWATHQDALSGSITVDIADDTTNDGLLTVPVSSFDGNSTTNSNVTFPGSLNLAYAGFDGLNFDGWATVWIWLVALVWCLRQGKLLAAFAATIGIAMVLLPGPEWIQWVAVGLAVLCLYLEAIVMESVYMRWFGAKGTDGRRRKPLDT